MQKLRKPLLYHLPLALAGVFWSASAMACYSPPQQQRMTPTELLIFRGSDVALAKVVRAEQRSEFDVRYVLEVERRFSGPGKKTFDVNGWPQHAETSDADHAATNVNFWGIDGGRLHHAPDCIIHPWFIVGKTYLVFLEQPFTRKSFELIEDSRDAWLQFVEKHFASLSTPLPRKVVALRKRIEGCAHFSGEEAYDAARKKEIDTAIKPLQCTRLEKDRKSALRQYGHLPAARAALEGSK